MLLCYSQLVMKWRLKNYLDKHDLTPYSLVRATGVSPTTVYGLAQGKHERISLDVLDRVIWGLEKLTGETVELSDVLERDPAPVDDESALWLSAALTPPLEPWEWGPEGEPEGVPVEYVPGEGWVMDEGSA